MVKSKNAERVRCAREFKTLLREVQLDCIKKGDKPPTDTELTRRIACKMKKEDIIYEGFIPFK